MFKPKQIQAILISLISISALSIAGCGKPSGSSSQAGFHRESEGSIQSNIRALQTRKYREACDLDPEIVRKQNELAAAIDARAAEIEARVKASPVLKNWKRVLLGDFMVMEPTEALPQKEGWQSYVYSWKKIYSYYSQIKNLPTAKADWIWLNKSVRSIIPDDEDRLDGVNLYNDRNSGPLIARALQAVSACKADAGCHALILDIEARLFLAGNPLYTDKLKDFELHAADVERAAKLTRLENRLKTDLKRYDTATGFRLNPLVKRTSANELRLPLDAGALTGVQDSIAGFIEAVWSSKAISLKIDWVQSGPSYPDLFKMIVEVGTGGRSWVFWPTKTVHLFPDVKTRTIAHEIGHVLGFHDHYYGVWNAESCEYMEQYTERDLMSDSGVGSVTADEWAMLDERYPTKPSR